MGDALRDEGAPLSMSRSPGFICPLPNGEPFKVAEPVVTTFIWPIAATDATANAKKQIDLFITLLPNNHCGNLAYFSGVGRSEAANKSGNTNQGCNVYHRELSGAPFLRQLIDARKFARSLLIQAAGSAAPGAIMGAAAAIEGWS
ncbi:MAG TPA: hypothetical protein VKT78_09060 [Fimbriimonadaceae bacterium]|nr:hypothetical protein [Fimbriimonadaceae bacterium]